MCVPHTAINVWTDIRCEFVSLQDTKTKEERIFETQKILNTKMRKNFR